MLISLTVNLINSVHLIFYLIWIFLEVVADCLKVICTGQRVGPRQGREVIMGFKEVRKKAADILLSCDGHESTRR